MDIFSLLEKLEDLVQNATRVPLTGKVMLDPDELLALVDEIRETLPDEIRAATRLTDERERLLEDARSEAEAIVREAKAYANQLADEAAVTREAQAKADEMIEQAKRVAREIRSGAMEYADNLLAKLEESLGRAYMAVQKNREELRR